MAVSSAVYSTWGIGSPLGRGQWLVQASLGRAWGVGTGRAWAERARLCGRSKLLNCSVPPFLWLWLGDPEPVTMVTVKVMAVVTKTSLPSPRPGLV